MLGANRTRTELTFGLEPEGRSIDDHRGGDLTLPPRVSAGSRFVPDAVGSTMYAIELAFPDAGTTIVQMLSWCVGRLAR
jgi:hypothetical protein